jgi:hypothetical protein
MRTQVRIYDHLTRHDHVSTWDVPGRGLDPILGAIRAAFVKAFGSSPGPIENLGNGTFYVRGMKVEVVAEAPALPFIDPRRDEKNERRRQQSAQKRGVAA